MAEQNEKAGKEQKDQKQPQQAGKKEQMRDAVSIIRLAGKDVDGELSLVRALDEVKGIGSSMANAMSFAIEQKFGIPRSASIGSLSEAQMTQIEDVIKEPQKFGIPDYMLNRRKDFDTGKNIHNVGNDLVFSVRQDISHEVNLRTWKGFRHQYGQKVRGQHTRSTGRTGATVGVTKKSVKEQQAAASADKKPAAAGK
jgi:small subunit ribosomal protein S13